MAAFYPPKGDYVNQHTFPGMPLDVEVVHANHDPVRQAVIVTLYHETFPEIPDYTVPPEILGRTRVVAVNHFRMFPDLPPDLGPSCDAVVSNDLGIHGRVDTLFDERWGYGNSEREQMARYGIIGWDENDFAIFAPDRGPVIVNHLVKRNPRNAFIARHGFNPHCMKEDEVKAALKKEGIHSFRENGFPVMVDSDEAREIELQNLQDIYNHKVAIGEIKGSWSSDSPSAQNIPKTMKVGWDTEEIPSKPYFDNLRVLQDMMVAGMDPFNPGIFKDEADAMVALLNSATTGDEFMREAAKIQEKARCKGLFIPENLDAPVKLDRTTTIKNGDTIKLTYTQTIDGEIVSVSEPVLLKALVVEHQLDDIFTKFTNPDLGEPHEKPKVEIPEDPFNKTWRDKPSLL